MKLKNGTVHKIKKKKEKRKILQHSLIKMAFQQELSHK